LNTLPRERYDTTEEATPRVDSKAMVTVRQNRYSVPVSLVGLRVTATIAASAITIRHDGKVVAVHERLSGRHGVSAQLDHYLELLAVKPGALGAWVRNGISPLRLSSFPNLVVLLRPVV
jgi:hypothetical protein